MKKFIIVTLIAGTLTAQTPVQALKVQDAHALAQTDAALNIAERGADALKNLKAVCAQTSKLRTLVKRALIVGGVAAVAGLAIYFSCTTEYLLSLIDSAIVHAHGAIDTGTECVIPCIDGFIDTGSQCVGSLGTATATATATATPTATPIVTTAADCIAGFMDTGTECVISCAEGFINTGSECIVGSAVAVTMPVCPAAETIASAVKDTLLTLPATGSEVAIFNPNDVTQQCFNEFSTTRFQQIATGFVEGFKSFVGM